ncbi:hypothetical protein P3T31_002799 [Rhizobium sp. AN70]|nr:hypothetical protein [Rhizobium sp. AN70]
MLILYDSMTKVYGKFGDIWKPGNLGPSSGLATSTST